jgi:2-haloalkanoic acid dehalogenase type II
MSNPFPKPPKALIFDLMGTCTNWHASILNSLESHPSPQTLPSTSLSAFALEWRAGFFAEIHSRFENGLAQEDIDVTHRRVLDVLLDKWGVTDEEWGDEVREQLVRSWHRQEAWPDAGEALSRLKKHLYVVVLANGTTALQLSIVKSANLPFHMLFSSQLLGLTKPDPDIYRKAAELMGVNVDECVMVAAHAYDVRAAKEVGMGTVYVRRWSEDIEEDFGAITKEFDEFVDGREGGGLKKVADMLGC